MRFPSFRCTGERQSSLSPYWVRGFSADKAFRSLLLARFDVTDFSEPMDICYHTHFLLLLFVEFLVSFLALSGSLLSLPPDFRDQTE